MRIQLVSALCALSIAIAAAGREHVHPALAADRQDAAIAAAVREAQRTLDDFLQLAAAPPAGTQGFRVQVMVEDEHGIETFWITHFRVLDQGFVGEVANEPRVVKSVTWGQQLRFSREQITDWGYLRNGRQVGSFTVCALFKQMPAEQAAYYREEHGFDC